MWEKLLVNQHECLEWSMPAFNLQSYFEIVSQRDRDTLPNIINVKLAANSVVRLNEWRDYENLQQCVPACILHNKSYIQFFGP